MALTYTVTGLLKGSTYGFRYKARNLYGWGPYSETSFLLVAIEPGKAAQPTFISADDNNIFVELNLNTENRGTEITSHEI